MTQHMVPQRTLLEVERVHSGMMTKSMLNMQASTVAITYQVSYAAQN